MAAREPSYTGGKKAVAAWHRRRVLLWGVLGIAAVGLVGMLELAARHYGKPGPITIEVKEFVLPMAPASGAVLYASMCLTLVTLPWRARFLAVSAAIGVDGVFSLIRHLQGGKVAYGNGPLWVIAALGVIAVTRRTGQDRVVLLKGVGLAVLMMAGLRTGATWLLITSKTRPEVLDQYVATADHALGNPSWIMGRILKAAGSTWIQILAHVYQWLPLAAAVVTLYQLRNVAAERAFPRHYLVRTFLVIGLVGPAIYMLFPVVGPIYAYSARGGHWAVGYLWPYLQTAIKPPLHMPFDRVTARNCMPSLHTAWATAIFIHSRRGPVLLRWAGSLWLIATLAATLGFGYHYGADLVAGVVFVLTIEAALRSQARGWDRSGIRTALHGAAVFALLLLAYRFLPLPMAEHPRIFGPAIILLMISVIYHYVRTTTSWDEPSPATTRIPQLRPERERNWSEPAPAH